MENIRERLTYRQEGDYLIPNLVVLKDESNNYHIGKYGYLRLDYLKNYKKGEYEELKLNCTLSEHLKQVDIQTKEKVCLLIKQFKVNRNVSEELKDTDPLSWITTMNNIKKCAEEIVFNEIIFI